MQAPVAVKISTSMVPPPTQPSEGKSHRGGGIKNLPPLVNSSIFGPSPLSDRFCKILNFSFFCKIDPIWGDGQGGGPKILVFDNTAQLVLS